MSPTRGEFHAPPDKRTSKASSNFSEEGVEAEYFDTVDEAVSEKLEILPCR